jgi:hypothetical protein
MGGSSYYGYVQCMLKILYVLKFIFKSTTQKHLYNINCLRFKVCVLQVEGNLMSMSPLTKMFKSIINYIKDKLILDSIYNLFTLHLETFIYCTFSILL